MMRNSEPFRGIISYLSLSKVEQLHGKLEPLSGAKTTQTIETKIKGDLTAKLSGLLSFLSGQVSGGGERRILNVQEGEQNQYSKLAETIIYFQNKKAIVDLRDCIEKNLAPEEVFLYSVSSTFKADQSLNQTKYIESEREKEDLIPVLYSDVIATSGMCTLSTKVDNFDLLLACSLKFFGDMGSSRRFGKDGDPDTFVIRPHSGNHFFFNGDMPCQFDALFFLSHQEGNTLFGSPLVLYQSFRPSFASSAPIL